MASEKELVDVLRHALTTIGEERNLDQVIPRELSKNAKLFNVDAASNVNLFGTTALYLPVAVADGPAGRQTIYRLPIGEKTLMGLYVVHNRIFKDFYIRTSEREYSVSKESATGEILFEGKGVLQLLDERVGLGEILVESSSSSSAMATATGKCRCKRRWYVWSFIATEDCDCTGGRPPILS
jgi:hypothetical protein